MGFDESTAGLLTKSDSLLEAWGDLVPMSDYPQFDWPSSNTLGGVIPYTNLSDRQDGRFYPVFYNELDLAQIRGMARRIMSMSSHMSAALTALRTYTMGNGPTVTVTAKAKYARPDANSKCLQQLVDAVQEQLDLPQLLDEMHDRSREEGESLSVLHRTGDRVAAEIVEMDGLREPHVDAGLLEWIRDEFDIDCDAFVPSWTFGVLTHKRMTNIPLGYHVVYDPSGVDFEFYPAAQVVHMRRNVPQNVKRGVSDWYPCFDDLRNEAKLGRNMGVSAALQAAIAWIEEYQSGGSAASIGAATPQDVLRTLPTNLGAGGGTRTLKGSHYPPGAIIKVPQNKQYKPGPMGAERNGNFEIAAQYLLRRIGIRHNLPEYMISGDASNGNFASTLVAESPFVKAREADQEYMRRVAKAILWKALALVWEPLTGKPLEALEDLKRHYEIKVEFPQVQSRDPLQLAEKLEIEKRNGWVSDQTAMAELGRDPDHEKSLGAAPAQPQMLPGMGQGQEREQESGQPSFRQRVQESWDESLHPRDDSGRFVDKAKIEAAQKDPKKAKELLGEVTQPGERKKLESALKGTPGERAVQADNSKRKIRFTDDAEWADVVQESFREEDHPRDENGRFADKAASARKSHSDRVSKLGGEEVVRMVRKAGVTDGHLKKAGLDLSPDTESIEFEAEQDAKDNVASAKRQAKWYLKGLQKELSRQGDAFTPGELTVSPEFKIALKQSQRGHHTELAQHVADEVNRQVGKQVASAKDGLELIRDYGDDPQQLLFGIRSVVDEHQPSLLGQAASTAAKAVSAVLNAPEHIAKAIDDMGNASVANAHKVENFLHGKGEPGSENPVLAARRKKSIHESTLSAALQGALESVQTTDEARAILESVRGTDIIDGMAELSESFEGHKGRPGHVGGSVPKGDGGAALPATETPEFKNWFGDSKVVDSDGNPLVVYHGTVSDFDSFSADKSGSEAEYKELSKLGFFFTDDPEYAGDYADNAALAHNTGQNIRPVYLSIGNPYVTTSSDWDALHQRLSDGDISLEQMREELSGYDGIHIVGHNQPDEWVAFESHQIKSATGNKGSFRKDSPNIHESAS